jgi:hypothetical protein
MSDTENLPDNFLVRSQVKVAKYDYYLRHIYLSAHNNICRVGDPTHKYSDKVAYLSKTSSSLTGPKLSAPTADPTEQIGSSARLILRTVGNWKVWKYGTPKLHKVHTKFDTNPSSGSRVESCGRTARQTRSALLQRTHKHATNTWDMVP